MATWKAYAIPEVKKSLISKNSLLCFINKVKAPKSPVWLLRECKKKEVKKSNFQFSLFRTIENQNPHSMHLSIIQLPVDFKFQFQQDLKTKKKNKIPIQEKNIKYNTQNSIFFLVSNCFAWLAKKFPPKMDISLQSSRKIYQFISNCPKGKRTSSKFEINFLRKNFPVKQAETWFSLDHKTNCTITRFFSTLMKKKIPKLNPKININYWTKKNKEEKGKKHKT